MDWSLFGGAALCACACAMTACGGSPPNLVEGEGAGEPLGAATDAPTTMSAPRLPTQKAIACVQGTLRSCLVQLPTQGTVHNCFAGKQLCSGGTWTECQDLSMLVGESKQTFTASCPAGDSIRWTTLDYVFDAPADTSGVASVTIAVADHPEFALLDTSSSGPAPRGGTGSRDVEALLGPLAAQPGLTLQIMTTTTPDGAMAATASAKLSYACDSGHPL